MVDVRQSFCRNRSFGFSACACKTGQARILETGTWIGLSACAIGTAIAANGFGRLTTLEINGEAYECALENIQRYGIERFVEALLLSSMEYSPSEKLDMALFDSALALRGEEFYRFRPWFNDEAIIIFQGTAPHHKVVGDIVKTLAAAGMLVGLDLPTPRGIFIGKLVK